MFRALESQRARDRFRRYRTHGQDESSSTDALENAIGAVNVYLVIFKEGICTVGWFTLSFRRFLTHPLFQVSFRRYFRAYRKTKVTDIEFRRYIQLDVRSAFHGVYIINRSLKSSDWIAHGLLDSIVDSVCSSLPYSPNIPGFWCWTVLSHISDHREGG